jgi:hypothetical protein
LGSFGRALDNLREYFASHNWIEAKNLLLSNPLADSEDFLDAFELFLFRIDYLGQNDISREIANEITQLFLRSICSCDSSSCLNIALTTVTHSLCIENKHKGLAILLRNISSQDAAIIVHRAAIQCLDYEETIHGELNHCCFTAYYSSIQAAWCSMLLDPKSQEQLQDIHHIDDLTEDWRNLWFTTLYLLLAFDKKPIDLEYTRRNDWNIFNVISRFGHHIDQEVMILALKLYHTCDTHLHNCTTAIHEAAKNQILYRNKRQMKTDTQHSCETLPNNCESLVQLSPTTFLCKIVKKYKASASIVDSYGRLPLHLTLQYCRRNQEEMMKMKIDEDGCESLNGYEIHSFPMVKALVKANPETLTVPEPSTGLPSFLLGANDDNVGLDILFFMLRENPAVLGQHTTFSAKDTTKNKVVLLSDCNTSSSFTPSSKSYRTAKKRRVVSPINWEPQKKFRSSP